MDDAGLIENCLVINKTGTIVDAEVMEAVGIKEDVGIFLEDSENIENTETVKDN